jgi:hypothetical protein
MIAQSLAAPQAPLLGQDQLVVIPPMRFKLMLAALVLLAMGAPLAAGAMSLEQACHRFAGRLSDAQTSGDSQKAQTIYQKGSQRIAANFNGATCPNVQPPTP